MTAFKEELTSAVTTIFSNAWTTREGRKIPELSELGLGNDGVKLDATVLYADLADSTQLVADMSAEFAAEIYKAYLYCAARVITERGGTITAYDGDRIMGVYIGDSKNSQAVRTGLKIKWCVDNIINPALKQQYPGRNYSVSQKVGIDKSNLMVARTGMRGRNDLVWVGTAANNAAKMAALDLGYGTYISAGIYGQIADDAKYTNGVDMWTPLSSPMGYIYGSSWQWGV